MANTDFVTAAELLAMIGQARAFLCQKGLKKGDRCAAAGAQQHSLGGDGSGGHGGRLDCRSALFASGSGGTCRHDEGQLASADLLRRC